MDSVLIARIIYSIIIGLAIGAVMTSAALLGGWWEVVHVAALMMMGAAGAIWLADLWSGE